MDGVEEERLSSKETTSPSDASWETSEGERKERKKRWMKKRRERRYETNKTL